MPFDTPRKYSVWSDPATAGSNRPKTDEQDERLRKQEQCSVSSESKQKTVLRGRHFFGFHPRSTRTYFVEAKLFRSRTPLHISAALAILAKTLHQEKFHFMVI
jgi:hypothetical protein